MKKQITYPEYSGFNYYPNLKCYDRKGDLISPCKDVNKLFIDSHSTYNRIRSDGPGFDRIWSDGKYHSNPAYSLLFGPLGHRFCYEGPGWYEVDEYRHRFLKIQ